MLSGKKGHERSIFLPPTLSDITVHFLGNLDSRKKRPEQDVCQNDRGDPPKRKTAFFQIFTDAISRNFAVTVQIGAI